MDSAAVLNLTVSNMQHTTVYDAQSKRDFIMSFFFLFLLLLLLPLLSSSSSSSSASGMPRML